MKVLKIICLIIILSVLYSCKGPKGDMGPAGLEGNANVQSATVETIASDWSWDANALNWYVDFNWDAIDFGIVDYGALLVYMENPDTSFYAWHQLPLTIYPNDQYSSSLEVSYYDYGFTIFWTNSDLNQGQNPCNLYDSGILEFKTVLIDATSYSKYKNMDLSDYSTVKKLFKIEE